MLPVDRFNNFITQNRLFNVTDTVLAAVSGGMDSVLMAHLLKAAGFNFAIAHCNFNLRGADSDDDEIFCRQLAQSFNVPFHTTRFTTTDFAAEHKISIQMAARQLRYTWFRQLRVQDAYTCIALAHHQNDTVETILLNLTRGTGIAGLHGILPKNGELIRPMLFLQRQEIEGIVKANNISYREDASNASNKYARNKIRLEVIPKLKELNPALEQTVGRNQQHFLELQQLLDNEVESVRQHLVKQSNDEYHLPLVIVKDLKPQRLLLHGLFKHYGFEESHIDDLISILDKHSGRRIEADQYVILLDRDKLIFKKNDTVVTQPAQLMEGCTEINYGGYHLNLLQDDSPLIVKDNPLAVSVDADKLIYPLTIRSWQQGDYFYPLGMQSKQKLSDFFIHQKLPLHQKQQVPVVVNGNGCIVWLGGLRLDDRYKVSAKTKKVTIFELYKTP